MEEKTNQDSNKKEPVKSTQGKFAVIRVRGLVGVNRKLNYTMDIMGLYRKNYCVLIEKKDLGMIAKIKDYVTYGEIDSETEKLLMEKQEKTKDHKGNEVIKKFFRLNPPRKGFGRKGIKVSFSKSGALGYRAEKINDLIKRML